MEKRGASDLEAVRGGGRGGTGAVPTSATAREAWYAAALALQRAFAADPQWQRRRQ